MGRTRLTLCTIVLVLALPACGGWFENTKAGLLSANDAVNAYDDVATEVWGEKAQEDSPEGLAAFRSLELSTCVTYLVQDAIVMAWGTAAMVDAGIKQKSDMNVWIAWAITLLDHAENVFQLWSGDDVPELVKGAVDFMERTLDNFNPGGVLPPGVDPPSELDCKAVVKARAK